jgi:hypothetical protein
MTAPEDPVLLEGGGRTLVHRRGNTVIRNAGPWTPTVHVLLRHLETVGFGTAPRLVGSAFDADGRETLTYIEGEFTQPGPWSMDGPPQSAFCSATCTAPLARSGRPPTRCGSRGTAGTSAGRAR